MKVSLIQQTENPIEFISKIASICYGNEEAKNPEKLVRFLYNNGHHSVFEHIYFTFKIEGVSRSLTHQLVRHRMCSFTQRSQRYCDESAFEIVIPETLKGNPVFEKTISTIRAAYDVLSKQVPKEDARAILPNACTTELYMSCNLRELIHIANERLCTKAQSEIREMVSQMVSLVDMNIAWMLAPKCQSGFFSCKNKCDVERKN